MLWDEPEISRLAAQHAPTYPLDRVREIAAWVEKRTTETEVANPTALLVACLKSAHSQPKREPRQPEPARPALRLAEHMSDEEWQESERARQACLPELRRIFGQDYGKPSGLHDAAPQS